MREPGERSEDTVAGAAAQSSEDSRQVMPLNHPGRRGFRLVQVVAAVVLVVWSVVTVGIADQRTVVAIVLAVLVAAAALPGGNLTAAGTTALGVLIMLLTVLQLAVLSTSLNFFDASVLNICAVLAFGLITFSCGLYEWETDEHGRIERRLRGSARDVRHADADKPARRDESSRRA